MTRNELKKLGYEELNRAGIGHACPQNNFMPPDPGGSLWISPSGRTWFLKDDGSLLNFKEFRKERSQKIFGV